MRLRFISITPVLLFIFLVLHVKSFSQQPDLILINGKIFTSDTTQRYVQALAIKGNKIIAVGSNVFIEKTASSKTKRIDLAGKTVVPGFNDAHDHLAWPSPITQSFITEFAVPGPTKKEVIDSLSRLVKRASPGQWIQGTIGLTVFNDTNFRRKLLDSISPNNPVALNIMWGHGMIINSKALKAIKVTDTDADPLGGWYERTPGTKYITGALYEYAQFPVWQALAIIEPAKMVKALQAHAQEEMELGITTVQNMNSLLRGNAAKRIYKEAQLPVRTRIISMPGTTAKGRDLADWNNNENWSNSLSYISGIKYVIDGTPLEQTALKTKPYPDKNNWYGRLDFPVDSIKQILKEALTSNRQLMLHIVGDSATKIVLDLMKQMATPEQWKQKRVRIEHGSGITTAASINDVKRLGIIIVNTPSSKKKPLHTWIDAGIPVAIGPDGLINPYLNIMSMSAQQTDPNQNITVEQAVMAYTKGSAYAEFAEKKKGTLMPGMLADLAVLSQDIFSIPKDQLPKTKSVLTLIDGKIVYQQIHK